MISSSLRRRAETAAEPTAGPTAVVSGRVRALVGDLLGREGEGVRSIELPSVAAQVALAATAISSGAMILGLVRVNDALADGRDSAGVESTVDGVLGPLLLVAVLVVLGVLALWSQRLDATLSARGEGTGDDYRWTGDWSFLAWIVPIVNFVAPALALRDFGQRVGSGDARRRDVLVGLWWGLLAVGALTIVIVGVADIAGSSGSRTANSWRALGYALVAASCGAGIVVVESLTRSVASSMDR